MSQRSPLSPNRCSVLRATGHLCGWGVMPDAPYPVCKVHAKKLYEFMLTKYPPRDPTAAEMKLDMLDRARDQRAEQERRAKVLYAAQAQVYYLRIHDYVKIGTTQNVRARLGQLRVDDPDALMATEPGGYELEGKRHAQFAAERIGRRENFHPSPRLLEHIASVKAEHGEPRITGYVKTY